jgi:hypothetical protein
MLNEIFDNTLSENSRIVTKRKMGFRHPFFEETIIRSIGFNSYYDEVDKIKTTLTNERIQQEKDRRLEANPIQEQTSGDDSTSSLLSHSVIDSISSLLTQNQSKWLKAHCLYRKTPSEIAKAEGVIHFCSESMA